MAAKERKLLQAYIEEELLTALGVYCSAEKKSMSSYVRGLIAADLLSRGLITKDMLIDMSGIIAR